MVRSPRFSALAQAICRGLQGARNRPKTCSAAVLLLIVAWGFSQPQQFVGLWLSPDQQGQLLFDRGRYQEAANMFSDYRWRAYSQYAAQHFELAADTWSQGDHPVDRFAQANALAQNSDFTAAAAMYRQVLEQEADHGGAQFNLKLVEHLEKSMPGQAGKANKGSALRMQDDEEQIVEGEEEATLPGPMPTDEMWLEQVNANPAVFLQKKFLLEYDNARRSAGRGEGES